MTVRNFFLTKESFRNWEFKHQYEISTSNSGSTSEISRTSEVLHTAYSKSELPVFETSEVREPSEVVRAVEDSVRHLLDNACPKYLQPIDTEMTSILS